MTEQSFFNICPPQLLERCRDAIEQGFNDYAENYSSVADVHDTRTVANIIHDHIVARVKNQVCDDAFQFRYARQRNLFILNNEIIITFKKLDTNLQSNNYPTKAAQDFNAQEELSGIPSDLPRIEMGYVPDAIGASLNGVFAVYKNGKKIDWSIDLNDAEGPQQSDIKFA